MNSGDWEKIKQILEGALQIAPPGRAAYLDEACSGNADLRRELEELLAASVDEADIIRDVIDDAAAGLSALHNETSSPLDYWGLVGTSVQHYKVLAHVGAGGFGVVYKAEDSRLERYVALKFLKPGGLDPVSMERFQREARAASALNHPSICTVYDIGSHEEQPFIAMEFLEGETLKARISARRLTILEIADIGIAVAEGLEAAQSKDIIHRDIKPANIFITDKGGIKILDFGLAKPVKVLDKEHSTGDGVVMGTAHYMSPEQAFGRKLDHRTDIFSLGVVLYEMVAGRPPFDGETASEIIDQIHHYDPPPLAKERFDVPAALDGIIGRCIEKNINSRYQTAKDVAAELRHLRASLQSGHIRAARVGIPGSYVVLLALAFVMAIGLGLFFGYGAFRGLTPAVGPSSGIPFLDLSGQLFRQIIVDREAGQFLGHTTTVLLEDGKTMIAVYPNGHGRGPIIMKRSTDGGRTWTARLPVPENWSTSRNVPTIHRTIDRNGKKRLLLFSGLFPIRQAISEDDGITWSPLTPIGNFGAVVAMSSVERLSSGDYMALFHDDGSMLYEEKPAPIPPRFVVYKTISSDGGLNWSPPEAVASNAQAQLCEPGLVRSPDGKQLAVLLRENSRRFNSFVIFSNDEGKTWTEPRELPGALTGDRHVAKLHPSGRLVITFRDRMLNNPAYGDWVAWVGTYDDIVNGRDGQYRVRLMDNMQPWDSAYSGLELLPDDTFVFTSYGSWRIAESPYIVSVRLKLSELDDMAARQQ